MKWKDIKVEKPPLGKGILITDGENITICEIERWKTREKEERFSMLGYGFGGFELEYDFNYKDITHWMELPKLPGN